MSIASEASELSTDRVFDPDVYGNGDPETFGLPLDLYARMRAEEPLVKVKMDHPMLIDEVWVISRHRDIWEMDRDQETWASGRDHPLIWSYAPLNPKDKPGLLVQDGTEHRDKRKQVSHAFRPANTQRLEEKFRRYSVEAVEKAVAKRDFDFVQDLAHTLPVQALGDVMGIPEADRPQFFAWVDTFASPFDERVTPSFEVVAKSLMELWEYGLELVKEKERNPGDDVMTMIAQMNLPDNEIQGNVALFASGAAETTRAALSHGMHELMRRPDQMAWVREHQDDIPATLPQEFVRIGNAIISLCRIATRDVEMHGETIREGEKVAMLFASGNFDEDAIENPRDFDCARDPNPHLGFGRGPHSCLGKHIAAFEIKILMEELLARTRSIEPAGPIDYVRDNYARGVYSLPVTVEPV
jgi:cholest-4-en-3-one 26-monooxygenase